MSMNEVTKERGREGEREPDNKLLQIAREGDNVGPPAGTEICCEMRDTKRAEDAIGAVLQDVRVKNTVQYIYSIGLLTIDCASRL